MPQFAQLLKTQRLKKALRLSDVAKALQMDKALVSKIERGDRLATQKQMENFIAFYTLDKKNAHILWLSDKIIALVQEQKYAIDALHATEIQLTKQANTKESYTENNEIKYLVEKVNALYKQYIAHLPLSDAKQEKIQLQYIFDINRKNGNSLSLAETEAVIFDGKTINGKSMQEHLFAVNHYDALEQLKNKDNVFSLDLLCKIHAILYKGIDRRNAGKIRTKNLALSKTTQAVEALLIAKKIEELNLYFQQNKENDTIVKTAIEVYCQMIQISPFLQGNEMIAYWAMNFVLQTHQFPLLWLKSDTFAQKDYQNSLFLLLEKQNANTLYTLLLRRLIDVLS